jgi:hypothetical protein
MKMLRLWESEPDAFAAIDHTVTELRALSGAADSLAAKLSGADAESARAIAKTAKKLDDQLLSAGLTLADVLRDFPVTPKV